MRNPQVYIMIEIKDDHSMILLTSKGNVVYIYYIGMYIYNLHYKFVDLFSI